MQPVRKNIQVAHADKMKEEPILTLLVDGNSLLFFCMSDTKVNTEGVHYGGVFQFLLQLKMLLAKRTFDYVYVVFDNEYSGYLRYETYKEYKANRDKHYADYGISDYMKEVNAKVNQMMKYFKEKQNTKQKNSSKEKSGWEKFIDENFDRERDILCNCFNELFIRWNIDEITEGDDQIAYYCLHKKPNENICIVSGDMDLAQLLADDVCIYNLNLKKFITNKNFSDYFGYDYRNILVKKIFTGDSSDNIGNIKGLSEEGFFKLVPEAKTREVTIEEVKQRAKEKIQERIDEKKKPLQLHENILNGISNKNYDGDFYEINEKLINLKKPLLSKEATETFDNMMYAPQDPEDRSFKNLYKIIVKEGIDELKGDTKFASFFAPFKSFVEREEKRYKDSLNE